MWARGAGGVPDVVDDAFDQFMTIQGCQNVTISCISDKPTYGGIIVAVVCTLSSYCRLSCTGMTVECPLCFSLYTTC